MRKRRVLVAAFALLGMVIAVAGYAWTEYAYHHHLATPNYLFLLLLGLDPPSGLSVVFIDVKLTESDVVVMWFVIALLNATLYASIAVWGSRRIWKSN